MRSPDRMADKETGQLREVDASVKYQVGSVPILITIECRDRVETEDVTWIEQLIAKRDSIGASATVAVSSAGFSAPALKKAAANRIETRTFREISEDAIREWAQRFEVLVIGSSVQMRQLGVHYKHWDGGTLALVPEVAAGLAEGMEYKSCTWRRATSTASTTSFASIMWERRRSRLLPTESPLPFRRCPRLRSRYPRISRAYATARS